MLVAYVGFVFCAFLLYSFIYARTRSKQVPDYVIILGSGLIGGKVPPLLAGRLDKAVQIHRAAPEGSRPVLIPSGGQGPDETRSEGAAMADGIARWLEAHTGEKGGASEGALAPPEPCHAVKL